MHRLEQAVEKECLLVVWPKIKGVAHEQPGVACVDRLKVQAPATIKDQRARRLNQRDAHGCPLLQRAVGLERHQVAGLELLEIGNDTTSTVHVRRELVLKEVIAVEPAATLTKLHHPGPDLLDRRVDRERGGGDDSRWWGQ